MGRKPSRKTLINKLDKIVTEIVLLRDNACVTCGSVETPGNGHLFSRTHYSTRWDLRNCNRQCWPCNFKHEKNPYPYFRWFEDQFGKEALEELNKDHNQVTHLKMFQLEAMYEELKVVRDNLKKVSNMKGGE